MAPLTSRRLRARDKPTIMSAQQFDMMWNSLDADQPMEKLARAAAGERRIRRG